jgi:hypothetical protein
LLLRDNFEHSLNARFCELRVRQLSSNPVTGLFGCLEQVLSADGTLAQPRLQMPTPPVLRTVGLAVQTGYDSGELAISEDELAFTVMAVDEHVA